MRAPDDDVKQALAQVAKLGGFQIKKMSTSDDMKDRVLIITLFRPSDGWVQERLAFEDEAPALVATVDANGHVDKIEGVQPGDLAETGAEADQEIAAAAETDPDDEPKDPNHGAGDSIEQEPKPDVHLVGEAAAAGRKRR